MKNRVNYGMPFRPVLYRMVIMSLLLLIFIFLIFQEIYFPLIFLYFVFMILFSYYFCLYSYRNFFTVRRNILLDELIKMADLTGNECILDIGTGSGFLAIGFAKHLTQGCVYAIDRYAADTINIFKIIYEVIKINFIVCSLKQAKRNAEIENVTAYCKFINSNLLEGLDFDDNYFDLIVSSQTIPFILKETDNEAAVVREIDRVLKNNGKILLIESKKYKEWDITNFQRYFEELGYETRIIEKKFHLNDCFFIAEKKLSE